MNRLTGTIVLFSASLPFSLVDATIAQQRVSDTVHNLSATGPGAIRAQTEQQVCIFCHAPHNTSGSKPLWNRNLPVGSYTIYTSSTLDAQPGQPSGSSKLCLSCHDGTIALGFVLSRTDRIAMIGSDFIPAGLTNLGTDLSNDHPVSFSYTSSLAASDLQLTDPGTLPTAVRLDATGEMQCTSCHAPHDNSNGDFLVLGEEFGQLCTACHQMNGWDGSSHESSSASTAGAGTGEWPFDSVAQNACRSCHRPHAAGGAERLLIVRQEEDNCLRCHDGTVAQTDISSEIAKLRAHDPAEFLDIHDPAESPTPSQEHVECTDCHNPHAAQPVTQTTGYVPIGPTLLGSPGVTSGGTSIDNSQFEYQICFRCHGDTAVHISNPVQRLAQTSNLRLKFSPNSFSFHPVVTSVTSSDTVSLILGLTPGSLIRCTDCHNNDSGPRNNGAGPDGPHGSIHPYLLERNYVIAASASESAARYAMCYKCHQRSSILSDDSFKEHKMHIVDENSPCSACHAPHGISATVGSGSDHTHLINFDTSVVRPEPDSGLLEFRDLGQFAGSCTLTCHGEDHRDERYSR